MKGFSAWAFTIVLCIYTIVHYISYLFPINILVVLLSVTGILLLVFAGIYLSFRAFALPLFLITAAVVVHLATGGSILQLGMDGILEMRSLIALLLIVPIISWILKEEPYIEEIMSFAHNALNSSRKFYFGVMIINQIIAYFLLFGAIPMMYQFVNGFLGEKDGEAWENYKSTALLRSFSLTTLWVISIPSFIFAVDHLGASLGLSILQGFMISLCGIGLAVIFANFQARKYKVDITAGIQEEVENVMQHSLESGKWNRYVIEFVLLFVSLFGTIFLLHIIVGWELLIIIPPTIFVWTCAYFMMKKKSNRFVLQCKDYFANEIRNKSQQFSILLSAGLLIFSVNQSGLGNYIIDGIYFVANLVPFFNLLTVLPFVVILLGFIGLGPLTVMVLVVGILENVPLPYPPELVVLSITSGSVMAVLLSPFILPAIALSGSNGLSVVKNSMVFNFGYAAAFYCIVQLYIQAMWYVVV